MLILLTAFVESIKEAFAHAERAQINKTVVLSAFFKICWIVPLVFFHDMFRVSSYYAAMQGHGDEVIWIALFGALLLVDVAALSARSFPAQVIALLAGAGLWPIIAILIGSSAPHGSLGIPAAPGAIAYLGIGLTCAVGVVQRCMKFAGDTVTARVEAARSRIESGRMDPADIRTIGNILDALPH